MVKNNLVFISETSKRNICGGDKRRRLQVGKKCNGW